MHTRVRFTLVMVLLACWAAPVHARVVKFSVTADNRYQSGFATLLNEIDLRAGGPGEFMVSGGDIDRSATTRARLDTAFGTDFTWYPVMGNHDKPGGGQEAYYGENMDYLRAYDLGPVNHGPAPTANTTYSFDAGPVHIVALNEYWDGGSYTGSDAGAYGDVVPALRNWLDADLASTDKTWKIVVGHEPAYPWPDEDWGDARHVGDSLDQNPANRDAFWSVLEDHDVTAYITAHTHRFSHYKPPGSDVWQIDAAQAQGTGKYDTFMIVTADDFDIQFDVYRSLGTGQFSLTDSWAETVLIGDVDGSGYVDDHDLSLLLAYWDYGVGPAQGDLNSNGTVDDDDLSLLLANWNQGTEPTGAAVPEPAALSLLLAGAFALIRRKRR